MTLVCIGDGSSETATRSGRDREGGSRRRGRGFVLRASDDVLIFISCY